MASKRALKVTRISVETDESTSIDRQDQAIDTKVDERGDTLVGVAEDRNVSAFKIGPFQRPALGPWLSHRVDEFDVLYVMRQDRVVRSMQDMNDLVSWADKHGKEIVICEGPGEKLPLDFSKQISQEQRMISMFVLMAISMASNLEVQAIKDRVTSSHKFLRERGEWGGGMIPYGLMPARKEGQRRGWKLVHNPETLPVLEEIVARVISGERLLPICRDLSARNVPTPRDYWDIAKGRPRSRERRWNVNSIKKILTNRYLLGEWIYDGVLNVDDRSGEPIPRCDPIVGQTEWDALQSALQLNGMAQKQRYSEPNPLLGVALCSRCGLPFYLKQETQKGRVYANLSCKSRHGDQHRSCGQPTLSLKYAVTITDELINGMIGDAEVMRRVYQAASDQSEEKARLERRISDLEDEYDSGLVRDRERYLKRKKSLLDQLDVIGPVPVQEAKFEWVGTGTTYGATWASLAPSARLSLLNDLGIKIYMGRGESPAGEAALRSLRNNATSFRLGAELDETETNRLLAQTQDGSRVPKNIRVWLVQEGDAPLHELVARRSKG